METKGHSDARPYTECDTEVIIVGARVAGAVLAGALGKMGHRVLVLDRSQFPSDTLSTHFFREPTFRALERLGVFEEVKRLAPSLTMNHNVVETHTFDEPVEYSNERSFCLCVRRLSMDGLLVRSVASQENVDIHEGATVTDLFSVGGRLAGVRWSEGSETFEAVANVVVGADGVHSTVASFVHPEVETGQKVQRLMYYAYFSHLAGQEEASAEFHYRGNSLAYVFPTEEHLALVAVSLPIAEFAEFRRDATRNFLKWVGSFPSIAGRLATSDLASPVRGTGNIPSYQKVPYGAGWALVGDAAQVMDPWSGQGMDQASTHALLLADSIDAYLSRSAPWETAMARYHHRRNAFSMKAYQRTTAHAADFRPMTRAALVRRGLT